MESSNLTESPADNVTKLLLEVSNGDRNAVDLLLPVMNFVSLQRITANCYCRRDIHMMVAPRADGPPSEQVVLEVTSRTKAADETDVRNTQVANPGESTQDALPIQDWSLETLKRELIGRQVRFEGWLLFDSSHAGESENTAPGIANNWRATAWELHPVTKIEIPT